MSEAVSSPGSVPVRAPVRLALAWVVAAARGGVIGHAGGMPWHFPEDLKHFRRVTLGHSVIMGRKTYESIGRPLPQRRNLVITRRADLVCPGVEVFSDVESAVAAARATDEAPRIIGGGEIYRATASQVTEVFRTDIDEDFPGDTWLPPLDEGSWDVVERTAALTPGLTFVHLQRRR